MTKIEKCCWSLWLVGLLILLFASSCKSRDMQKSSTSQQVESSQEATQSNELADKSKEQSKSDQQTESDKKTKEEVKKTAFKLTPVDSSKPIIIKDSDGKETSISNAVVESEDSQKTTETEEKTKEIKTQEASKENDVVQKSGSSSKGNFKAKSEADNKRTKSEPVSIFSFWWLAVIAIIAWFIYKKVKNNGWKSVFKFIK